MTTVALASDSTTRKRIYERFALDSWHEDALTEEVAAIRATAYEQRLKQLATSMGVDAPVLLTDEAVLSRLANDARATAQSVVETHNNELRNLIAQQPRNLRQAELSSRVRDWEQQRSDAKATQVATTEAYAGFNQAFDDVISRNGFSVKVRAVPRSAQEPKCNDLIARGWIGQGDAPNLPLHPHCVHSYQTKEPLIRQASKKTFLWLGAQHKT